MNRYWKAAGGIVGLLILASLTNGHIRKALADAASPVYLVLSGQAITATNPLPVTLESSGGPSDINIAKTNGVTLSESNPLSETPTLNGAPVSGINPLPTTAALSGQGTSASSPLYVTNPLSGVIPAGANVIGKVGIDQTTPGVTNGTTVAPTSAAAAGIAPSVSAPVSGLLLKSSGGNLYDVYITTGGTAGFLLITNSTALSFSTALSLITGVNNGNLQDCVPAPANTTTQISYTPGPLEVFANGIAAYFSVPAAGQGCTSFLPTSATAFIHGRVQ